MSSSKKGYVYTLEVLLAVSIVFLSMVFAFKMPEFSPDTSSVSLKSRGEEALRNLDTRGTLRSFVIYNDIDALRGNLTDILPQNTGFDVEICRELCEEPALPDEKTIVHIKYYISGDAEEYDISTVHLWLWLIS